MHLYPLAKSIHEQHLRDAAKRRLYHQVAQGTPPLWKRLYRDDRLIAFAGAIWARLKAHSAVQVRAHRPVRCLKPKGTQ